MKQLVRPFEEHAREDRADCIYDRFVDAIVTGHLKRGARLPTMQRIAEENGATFRVARGVVERLGREGYVKSYPHRGTIVRAKKHTVWRGRILFVSFDDDSSSYFVTRVADALRRQLVAEEYLVTQIVASRSPRGDVSQLKTALGQSVDFVVLMYSAKHLEKIVAASGVPYAVIYGDAPSRPNAWTIPFDISEPIAKFVNHCRRDGIGSVTEVNFYEKAFPSAVRELKASGIRTRELVIEPLARYGRYEGIERAAMETFLKLPISEFPDLFLIWDEKRGIGKRAASVYGYHSLRATFVVLATEAGVPLADIARVVGHTTTDMTMQYFNPERKHAAERVRRQMRGSVLDGNAPAKIGTHKHAAVVPAAPSVDDVIAALTDKQRKELARKLLGL